MRLNKQLAAQATEDILELLQGNPDGLRTSELTGTHRFHGERTLSLAQVRKLLHNCEDVTSYRCGHGMRTWLEWRAVS